MKKLVAYFIIFHTIMLLVTGVGMWIILKLFFPELLLNSFFVIPLFFYVMGLIFILQFRRTPRQSVKVVNMFMLIRTFKIFTSFILILFYWVLDKSNIRDFAILFIIFYLISLVWETYIYLRMEKYMKYKNDQEKPPKERISQ